MESMNGPEHEQWTVNAVHRLRVFERAHSRYSVVEDIARGILKFFKGGPKTDLHHGMNYDTFLWHSVMFGRWEKCPGSRMSFVRPVGLVGFLFFFF